jgi:Leucine-rich repeat (LRR) protein
MKQSYYKDLIDKSVIPDDVEIFNCDRMQLFELPTLPSGLISLFCFINNLSELPYLPDSLKILNCSTNNISELPKLPNLIRLFAEYNPIKYISIENFKIAKKIYYTNKYFISLENTLILENTGFSNFDKLFSSDTSYY